MVAPIEPEERLHARCYAGMVDAWRRLTRVMPSAAIEERDGATLIATQIPIPFFNPVFLSRPPADLAATLAHAGAFYARHGLPWLLRACGDTARAIAPALEAAGFDAEPVLPGMVLAPLPAAAPPASPVDIRVVADLPTLRVYNQILATVFDFPVELFAPFETPEFLASFDLVAYLGYVDGLPVATALRVTADRVASVFNIGTLPEYQRRGIGTAMTLHAALDAREGTLASMLVSSEQGYQVYERIGYRRVLDVQSWSPPVPEDDRPQAGQH
jgi:ribosomal protein S18 acetylase RimI-like enzyme